MDVRGTAHLGIACVLGLMSVATVAGPVSIPTQPVTVIAYDTPRLNRLVPYGDLALMTSEGRQLLMHRVGKAVDEVCPIFDDEGNIYDTGDCRAFAWRSARQQIKQAINLARSGSRVAMVIEVAAPTPR